MKITNFEKKYLLDARSIEERNARSLALGKEKLSQGKTRQAMRLFAYNHALNQSTPKSTAPSGKPTTWKVRVWKNNKVVKTMTVEKDDEVFIKQKVNGLGIDWDKATVLDPKTMKQQKSYKNASVAQYALNKNKSKSANPSNATLQNTISSKARLANITFKYQDPYNKWHTYKVSINLNKSYPENDLKNKALDEFWKKLHLDVRYKDVTAPLPPLSYTKFNNFGESLVDSLGTVILSYEGKVLNKASESIDKKFNFSASSYDDSIKKQNIQISNISI